MFHTVVAQSRVFVRVLMVGCCNASIPGLSGVAAAAATAAAVAVIAAAPAAAHAVPACGVVWQDCFRGVFHRVFHRCFIPRGAADQSDATAAIGR